MRLSQTFMSKMQMLEISDQHNVEIMKVCTLYRKGYEQFKMIIITALPDISVF